ncbi:DUF1800 family protein [Candidatus Thiodictyon syntrophicum]|uniref:DUF1800 family protein n=1 Tax=Candidatus Thiodictyon syntrophicum TaxID=1166950 RepID=UPI0012FD8A51|nr:DUF1800 family protein [Candidatus Thiodictyon syntrophicum]
MGGLGFALVLALSAAGARAAVPGGLVFDLYTGEWNQLPDFETLIPAGTGIAPGPVLDPVPAQQDFAVRYRGWIEVPVGGQYRFYTRSDDGSALYVDDQRVVANDGLHGAATRWGNVTLTPGTHALRVEFFQRGGSRLLDVGYRDPAGTLRPIAPAALAYDPDLLPEPRDPDQPTGAVYAGLAYEYHQGDWSALPAFDGLTPLFEGVADGFTLTERLRDDRYAFRFQGYLEVPQDGVYTFHLGSDDGAALFIGDRKVVDNDGLHAMRERAGMAALRAGTHRVTLTFFQKTGEDRLVLDWSGPDLARTAIPAERLTHTLDLLPPLKEPDLPAGATNPGLAFRHYLGDWRALPDFDTLTPATQGVAAGFDLTQAIRGDRFGFSFKGYLRVPTDGIYRFYTTSDDGSRLWIGDTLVVDNDGERGVRRAMGAVALKAGLHAVRADYFLRWGSPVLALEYRTPTGETGAVPVADLFHTADQLPALRAPTAPAAPLKGGLAYAYHEGDFGTLDAMLATAPRAHGETAGFDLAPRAREDRFGFDYRGYIEVFEDGLYRFQSASDDGSRLWIGDTLVVDNDGQHALRTAYGSIGLKAGLHPIRVAYFDRGSDQILRVGYRSPDGAQVEVQSAALHHTQDQLPPLAAPADPGAPTLPGLAYAYYEGSFSAFPDFGALTALAHGVTPQASLAPARRNYKFALRLDGYLNIREPGFYRVQLRTGGATRLYIGDTLVVENPGRSWQTYFGALGLAAGPQPIRIEYFQGWGDQPFELLIEDPQGRRTPLAAGDLSHTAGQLPALEPAVTPPAGARSGLAYRYYEGAWSRLPDFPALTPVGLGAVTALGLERAAAADNFGFSFQGYVQVPADGFYDLGLRSDDGSRLWIGDRLVTDHDGLHGAEDRAGNIGLAAGWHPLRVDYFERWGDAVLELTWRGPDGLRVPVPAAALVYDPAVLPTLEPADAARGALVGGIQYAYYEGAFKVLPDFGSLTPVATGTLPGFTLEPRRRNDRYAFRFSGYIDIPEYGYYSFYTTSDDGSRLSIGGRVVVDNDGLHSARERSGRIGLERGRHQIQVDFFERDGDDTLSVHYAGPRFGRTPVTPAVLFRLDPAGNGDPGDPGAPEGPTDPAANRAPVAGTDTAGTGIGAGQSVAVAVLGNDTDPDGDILVLAGAGAAGATGAVLTDAAGGRLVYVPPLGFVGEDRVTYSLSDRRGGVGQGELVVQVGAGAAPRTSAAEAVRLLTQATFGPTKPDLAQVMLQGQTAWIDAQLGAAPTTHADALATVRGASGTPGNRELRVRAWLDRAVTAPDQLRQRVAFALSEILVVSDTQPALATNEGELGLVDYYDLLVRGAFGTYRDLLGAVTLHPVMGQYLNMAGNRKADPVLGTVPDENFAREILQLFALGLWQLGPDGTRVLDAEGNPVPSYTQAEVMQFARVFTGWDFAVQSGADKYRRPLVLDPAQHEDGPKTLLGGESLPAAQGGAADLEQALDNIAAHPNLPPFIARQLIQRLVTSNPSPAYVGRVAAAFADSGGNLGETLRTLLLDPEARDGTPDPLDGLAAANPELASPGPAYGKVREPLLALTALWRGLGIDPAAIRLRLDQLTPLGQVPLSAPSVFNFFKPDHQHPGEIADLGLYSPEFEAIDEKQVIGAATVIDDWTLGAAAHYDLTMELAFTAAGGDKAADHLNLLFLGGRMSEILRQTLKDELLGSGGGGTCAVGDQRQTERALGAVYLILTSPEFQTQR